MESEDLVGTKDPWGALQWAGGCLELGREAGAEDTDFRNHLEEKKLFIL